METENATDTRTIFLFRQEGSERVRYKFVLDKHMTILREERMAPMERPAQAITKAAKFNAGLDMLDKKGIAYHLDENGKIIIDKIPQREITISRFFQLDQPCPFEGCGELRARYKKELESMGGDSCKDCDKAKLLRKYHQIISTHILNGSEKDTQHTAYSGAGSLS